MDSIFVISYKLFFLELYINQLSCWDQSF